MAKAKKQDPAGEVTPKKEAPANEPTVQETAAARETATAKRAAGGRKSVKGKKGAAAAPPRAPVIDTNLAAQAAASMIANRAVAGLGSAAHAEMPTPHAAAAEQESSTFKHLKEGLNKPSAAALGEILGAGGGHKKLNQGFGGPKPSVPAGSRNQTFGADVNRAGVPRRTGG